MITSHRVNITSTERFYFAGGDKKIARGKLCDEESVHGDYFVTKSIAEGEGDDFSHGYFATSASNSIQVGGQLRC